MTYLKYVRHVIRVVADAFGSDEDAAAELLWRTGIAESGYRTRHQMHGGPARGLWQMEPATARDIHENFIAFRPELAKRMRSIGAGAHAGSSLVDNDYTACALARIHYLRVPESLPMVGEIAVQAEYWKLYYNTAEGKGTPEYFVRKVDRFESEWGGFRT